MPAHENVARSRFFSARRAMMVNLTEEQQIVEMLSSVIPP
jgi:hypothetical protein